MAILKDLIVHGPSHFIGKVFINDSHIAKINESDVPENPKFTDTVSSMSTTGTGNAITSVSVNNGSFTFTKGSTFLTSQNTAALYAGTSAATANTSASNTSAHLILKDGSTYNRIKIQGTAEIEVTANSNGVLSVGVPAKSSSLFYAGPASGAKAVPKFRNIGLTDLPVVSAITSAEINATSQKIATVSAISEYVEQTSIEYITGSNVATSSSAAWVGNSKEKGPLRVGKTIAYKLSHNPTGNATLQLSFSDGTASSAYPVYSMTTRVTTHYPKNSVIFMSFDGSYWRTTGWYNTNDTAQTVRLSQACAISKNAAQRYVIFFTNQQGELIPSYTGAYTTATTKNLNTGEYFDPFAPIYYCNSTATLAAGGTLASNVGLVRGAVSLAYGFNSSGLLTAKEPVYVRCIPSPEGTMVKLDGNNCIVQTLPTEEDGFVYILLGYAYNTSSISLIENHPVYTFKSGAIRNYQKDAQYDLGYVTPQMFGAKGDGVTDDTDAIQAALNSSLNVFLPPGVYIISYPLFIRSGTHFYGASSGATTIKAKVDTVNGTAFSISNMPHSSNFSNIGIQLNNLTQDQINTCRYLFVQEPEVGAYMLIVAESIRSQYANETGSLKRPGFTAGNTSSFLIENLTLDCNHTRVNYPVNNVGVGVGGLRLIRPYDRCNIKNIFVNNCTCRAIYVGDAVNPSYIQSNYTAWMNFENLIPSEEPDEQPEDLVKMLRRRTRSQTLVIDNCQFMGSKTGSKFTPDTYLYTYWRPNTYYPYTWQKISDIYTFNTSEYNKITSTQITFNGSNGTTAITPNSAGTAAGLSGYYVHNKIAVGGNIWLSNQTDYLAYFYNSFQLNLKDTKIMYSSTNFKIYPCVVFNNCTDLYVRGCSFAHTLGEGIRLTGGTKYFRLIANTYENLGVIKTNNGQPTGNGFRAGGLHNMFKTKSFESTSSLFTDRDYVIYCDGKPASDTAKRAPIVGGIIIETTYNNTPRDVYLQHTNDMFIIGTFKQLKTSIDDINTVVIGNLTGAIETNKFSTENLFKSYSVTTSSASSVGGWTYLGSTALSAPQGMVPIGVVVLSTSDARPATAYISGGNLYVRSTSNGASFTVRVTFAKS